MQQQTKKDLRQVGSLFGISDTRKSAGNTDAGTWVLLTEPAAPLRVWLIHSSIIYHRTVIVKRFLAFLPPGGCIWAAFCYGKKQNADRKTSVCRSTFGDVV